MGCVYVMGTGITWLPTTSPSEAKENATPEMVIGGSPGCRVVLANAKAGGRGVITAPEIVCEGRGEPDSAGDEV